jgi:glycosyltransferase involved in cell wall biosynthesis
VSAIGVVHITAAEGGGADRYIRDLAATTAARHWIWHASAGIVEDVADGSFHPAGDPATMQRWSAEAGIGLVHLHGVGDDCRRCLAVLQTGRGGGALPYLITLHDVAFVWPDAFGARAIATVDAQWITNLRPLFEHASAVVAPSAYIADLLWAHYRAASVRVEPGLRAPAVATDASAAIPAFVPPAGYLRRPGAKVVGVIGALGPHKGSLLLEPIAAGLVADTAMLVVVGYTDTQLERGMDTSGHYYVHGPYEDADLPSLLKGYGVDAVLFPNRLPESFSYTLSEVWAAGLPVIVPDAGALGERVTRLGGGWRLPAGFDADAGSGLINRLATTAGAAEWARVKSAINPDDPVRVPRLSAMADNFNVLYERFAQRAEPQRDQEALTALTALVAANLNGFAFRRELTNLANESAELRRWVGKLEADIAALKSAIDGLQQQNRELGDVRAAFEVLPAAAQKALYRWAFRGRR